MSKKLSGLLAIAIFLTCFSSAAGGRDLTAQHALAQQLEELGLLRGTGQGASGETEFALDRAVSRIEALTMLVRLSGDGAEAEAHPKTHPFSDVPDWADGVVSLAYERGLTRGVSPTEFDPEAQVSADMYLTFLLRALGYSDEAGGDFSWEAPRDLAEGCGLFPRRLQQDPFLRADLAEMTCAALFTPRKGEETTLCQQLAETGGLSSGQSAAADYLRGLLEAMGSRTGPFQGFVDAWMEAEPCAVILSSEWGGPRGGVPRLCLVYRPGFGQDPGTVVELPLTPGGLGTPAAPQNLALGPDGMTLTYDCPAMEPGGDALGQTIRYTVDLRTAAVLPDELPIPKG